MMGDLQQTVTWDGEQDSRNVVWMFALSALCHVVFFVLVMVMPTSLTSTYRLAPQSISVDLVSLPAGPPAAAAPAPTAPATEPEPEPDPEPVVKQEAAAPEPVPLPTPKEEPVPIAPKPKPEKVVKSLKKKTLKKKTIEKTVVQKPAPPAKPARQKTVSRAIESLRQKVATQEKSRATSTATAGTGSGAGGGGGGGTALLTRMQNYKLEAAYAVGQNWSFPQQLAGADEQLETRITFRILPNGEITDIKIVQPSGNRYLDESAFRAVQKASPVAPHPDGTNEPFIEIGVKATPSGFR